jgi:hypothetical protein
MLKINPLIHQSPPFFHPVKISSTGSTPAIQGSFKLDSRFIQGSFKVPFKVVFACNQGCSRLIKVKNFFRNLENLDPLTRGFGMPQISTAAAESRAASGVRAACCRFECHPHHSIPFSVSPWILFPCSLTS